MQLEHAAFFGVDVAHEIVVERQIDQQPASLGLPGERLRHLRRHARQAGDPQQKLLRLRLEALEDFAGEIVEYCLRRCVARERGELSGKLGVLKHEYDSRRPAPGPFLYLSGRLAGERLAAKLRDVRKLLRLESQALAADAHHSTGYAQPR